MIILNIFSIVDEGLEGKLLLFQKPLGFLRTKVVPVERVHSAWHVADLCELADVFESLSKLLIVSSELVQLTGPDHGLRIQLQNLIRRPSWEHLVIVLLVVKVGRKQFVHRSNDIRMAATSFLVDL